MRGTDDRKVFAEIAGKLRSIEKNINKYYSEINVEEHSRIIQTSKTPMIFISHSSKDKVHVELIVKLLKNMGFNQNNVFCSSIPGYGIKLSKDIYDTLLGLFSEHKLYVIFVHSPNYYDSPVSLNEMGAAWALKTSFCSFLLPGFEYSDMKGVVDSSKISIKVDRNREEVQNLLNELYEDLSTFFSIQRDTSIVWENARNEFIDRINATEVVVDNKLSLEAFEILKSADKDDRGVVFISRNTEGVIIQAGNASLNKPGIRREEARMEAAVRELISKGLLTQTGTDVFQITNLGYSYLDAIK